MHAPLTPLALCPQPPKSHLQITDLVQRLLVQLTHPRRVIGTHRALTLFFPCQGFLATHTRLGFLGKFHETAYFGCRDGDGAGVITCQQGLGFCLAEDGLEDAAEGFGELIVEVVFCVDGDVVLEDVDGVFGAFEILGASRAFDHDIGYTVAEGGGGTGVALLHAVGELDVSLLGGVVIFGEGFRDDELGHVDAVLKEVGDGVFDVSRGN